MSVLLDTGVLFAFLNAEDDLHARAVRWMQAVGEGRHGAPYVSDFVVAELFTLIRIRTRNAKLERAARSLLPLPEPALPGLRLLAVGPERLQAVADLYDQHRDRALSFTDASLLVLRTAYGLDRIATFDRRLAGLAPTLES